MKLNNVLLCLFLALLLGMAIDVLLMRTSEKYLSMTTTEQPTMTAERVGERPTNEAKRGYANATVISDPEFNGDSGIGVVKVEFGSSAQRHVLVARASEIKVGDGVAIEVLSYLPGGPELRIDCMIAVPKKK